MISSAPTTVDGLSLRAILGRREWMAPSRFGLDGWRLIRHDKATGEQKEYDLKIARLLKRGDTSANVRLEPGDVIIIPESMF